MRDIGMFEIARDCPIEEPKNMAAAITYFIGFGTEYVKIGKSTRERLAWRLKSMQVSSPLRLEVVCIENARRLGEREHHKRLAQYRHRGEWFRAEGDVLTTMRSIHEKMAPWDWFFCMNLSGVFEFEDEDEE